MLFASKDTFFPDYKITEILQLTAFFYRHVTHNRPFRTLPAPFDKIFQFQRRPLGLCIDRSVRLVPHKTRDAELVGDSPGAIPEPDSLNFSVDLYIEMFFHFFAPVDPARPSPRSGPAPAAANGLT